MWELDHKESWAQRIDASELLHWRRCLRVPWTANQSILKEISLKYSLEGLMLKLKLQYFGHLMQRTDHWKRPWCWERWRQEETEMTEDKMVGWHHRLDGHEFEQAPGVDDGQGSLVCCSPWGCKDQTWLSDWTELNWTEWLVVMNVSSCTYLILCIGFPGGTNGKEPIWQCRRLKRCMFNLWISKISQKREWQSMYSWLENHVDRRAWQATVHKVAKNRTWLKQLSMHAYVTWKKIYSNVLQFFKKCVVLFLQ